MISVHGKKQQAVPLMMSQADEVPTISAIHTDTLFLRQMSI